MRNAFISGLVKLAETNNDIFLLTGDLGFGVLDEFIEKFPNRYINTGIAEQNMASVAAGLAMNGKIVFIYSIANFPTMRCLEQIRNDIAYHNANVKIVTVGGGFAYGPAGITHHGTEDLAIMRVIPNMNIFIPCDPISAKQAAKDVCNIKGPCYVRLERGGEPIVFALDKEFHLGSLSRLKKGSKFAIISVGSVINEVLEASYQLKHDFNLDVSVYSIYTLKPINAEQVLDIASKHDCIITVEEHNIIGGVGSVICEIVAGSDVSAKVIRLGLKDEFSSVVGSQQFLRKVYGLSSESIESKVKEVIIK